MPPPLNSSLPPNPARARPLTPPAPALPGVPAPDSQAIGRLAAPNRPAFPYGRDLAATKTVGDVLTTPPRGTTPEAWGRSAGQLDEFAHGPRMRDDALTSARGQGYAPAGPDFAMPAATPSFAASVGRNYPWQAPPVDAGPGPSAYDPHGGQIHVGSGERNVTASHLASVRHEMDHALQQPAGGPWPWQRGNLEAGSELGPSMADMLYMSKDHQDTTGQPISHQVTFPSGASQDLGRMTKQAQQHGMFNGRSATDLLATPSGQAYTRMIADPTWSDRAARTPAAPAAPQGWGGWMISKLGF